MSFNSIPFNIIPLSIKHPYYINLIGMSKTYDMITENIAIGDHMSDYIPFDIVINLNYPDNKAKYHDIYKVKEEVNNKTIYIFSIGIYDHPDENITSLFNILFSELKQLMKNPKILFHCHAGISRSATVAIAYLSKTLHKSVYEMYHFVKTKRPCIEPNYGFVRKLIKYNNIRIVDDMINTIREERQAVKINSGSSQMESLEIEKSPDATRFQQMILEV